MDQWPPLPFDEWRATCDTLHAHTQVLGKLAAKLAPREPQWQHAALRLTARGWETAPLPSPDGTGSLVVALDLPAREAVVEYSSGVRTRIALTPHRSVAAVTREILAAVPVELDLKPQEVAWTTPFDEDEEHATFVPAHVDAYLTIRSRPRSSSPAPPQGGMAARPAGGTLSWQPASTACLRQSFDATLQRTRALQRSCNVAARSSSRPWNCEEDQ